MKKLVVLFALLFISFSATAQIYDASYTQKVKKLVKIESGPDSLVNPLLNKMMAYIPADKQEAFKAELKRQVKRFCSELVNIYLDILTKEEVDALLNFYTSPMGQEIQKKLPLIRKRTANRSQQLSERLLPVLKEYTK